MRGCSAARGRVAIERMPYPISGALETTQGVTHVILVGAQGARRRFLPIPASRPCFNPPQAEIITLATPAEDMLEGAGKARPSGSAHPAAFLFSTAGIAPSFPKGALTPGQHRRHPLQPVA